MVADTRETRAKQFQVYRNGAPSIKAPRSNIRGRQYSGAQVINTRTDYLTNYTFCTNHNIKMHGFRSSRAADLRKIKLQ